MRLLLREGERKKDSGESFGVWAEVERDFSGIPLLLERVCLLCCRGGGFGWLFDGDSRRVFG